MAVDTNPGLDDRRRRRLSKSSLVRIPAVVLLVSVVPFIVLAVRACSMSTVGEGIGASGVGVDLANRCPSPVFATAGESEQQALSSLTDDPIAVPPGERRMIDLIANAAYEPTRYFLAYQVADGPQGVREFDIVELERTLVRVDITSECELVVQASA